MAATRLLMRELRDILRLKYEAGLSHRAIARACSIGVSTVAVHLQRAVSAALRCPLPADLDDAAREARLFAGPGVVPAGARPLPDWRAVHLELKRPSVTLRLLWLEHRDTYPTGYGYSQFCDRYRRWARTLKPSMRQVHLAGEKLFVDFAGQKPALVDGTTGEVIGVELFVGVLGASGLIYAESTRTQALPAWVDAHRRMLDAFGGSTAIWVPDNLKSGITTPNRYEPEVNRTYAALAQPGAQRQSQSRSQCPDRRALGPRRPAASDLFRSRGAQCRDSRARRRHQWSPDEGPRPQPTGAVRATRSARAPPVAPDALRAGGMDPLCRQH